MIYLFDLGKTPWWSGSEIADTYSGRHAWTARGWVDSTRAACKATAPTVLGTDGSSSRYEAVHVAPPGAFAHDPAPFECDATARYVAARHPTSVEAVDIALTGAAAGHRAIVAA
jgi:hypothetical protein